MDQWNLALAAIGMLILALALLSGVVKGRLWLSSPLVALVAGVLMGPAVLGWLDLAHFGKPETLLEQATRLTIAIGVMAIALRVPWAYYRRHWRTQAVLLAVVLPAMWLVSGGLVHLVLGLPVWVALLVGAVLAPTDPVVATSLTTGKSAEENLPDRLRQTLSVESGANDGLAYLLVFLPILLLLRPPGEAIGHWLSMTLLWEVLVGGAIGALVGLAAGWLMRQAEALDEVEKTSLLAFSIALTLAVLGLVALVGANGLFAVFVCGVVFSRMIGGHERAEEEGVQEALNQLTLLPVFVVFGLMLPWAEWQALGWKGLLLAVAILLLRRWPVILATGRWLRPLHGPDDRHFYGWFGPIGVSAIFYALLAQHQTGLKEPWVVGSLLVCASVVAHGVTATPWTRRYGRRHAPPPSASAGEK